MTPSAIFFGAIGAITDTSDMQLDAFNAAFADHGLDWRWQRDEYREMLQRPGGLARIERYAEAQGEEVNAPAIYDAKVRHFREMAAKGLSPREGVAELIAEAKAQSIPVAFCTTTGADTVDLIFEGLSGKLSRDDFAFVGDRTQVAEPKPAADIYKLALQRLSLRPDGVFAIEDTPESALSAIGAGIATLGYPTWVSEGRAFPEQAHVVDRLSADMAHATLAPPHTAAAT